MNKLEKIVYDLVKQTPWIKFFLRNLYQSFFDLLPRKKEFFINPYHFKENYFFGFHDIDPFSSDCSKLLTNHSLINMQMPQKEDKLEVGYIDIIDEKMGDFHSLDSSNSWNYHKGCRLQWLSETEIIYNIALDSLLISKIFDIKTEKELIIDFPIDTVHKQKRIATSFSYERLERCMPGYGYPYKDNGYINSFSPEETGLFIIDLKQNTRKLLISIASLVKELNDKKFESGYWHFITHSEFSEDGRYVSFLHRWIGDDIKKRWTRMIIYDFQEDNWFTLPTQGWGVSHYVWNRKNQILGYCNIDNIDCHVVFDIPSGNYRKIALNKINSDGHQSFIGDNAFITDTYPDRYRMAKLFKVSLTSDKVELLASIFSPKEFQTKTYYKHIACDLHPRVSKNKKYVCFDSPRTGKRAIYIMKLN